MSQSVQDQRPGGPAARAVSALARAGAAARRLLLPLFCLQFILLDVALRRGRLFLSPASLPGFLLGAAHSACLWLAVAAAVLRRPRLRVAAALAAGVVVAFQGMFYLRFSRFADDSVARSAALSWSDIEPAFIAELPRLVAVMIIAAAVQALWLQACVRPAFDRRHAAAAALALLLLAPLSASLKGPPDLRFLGAVATLPFASAFGAPADPAPDQATTALPPLRPQPGQAPNIVLILTESIRADEYCSEPAASCPTAPEVNALFPERIGLPRMRSLASFTLVSVSALVTGRSQAVPREELIRSPTVFDVAKAIEGPGRAPYTAYWSAHEAPMFYWPDPKRSIDSYVTFETLFDQEGQSTNADRRLSEMFQARLAKLPSPFLAVLHFHDTHILYGFDEARAPFQPWTRDVRWETMPELRNAYRNAIYTQDRSIAAALKALRADPRWDRTVVLFTSDHGEAFGENHAIHHGQNLHDEQTRVPAWIAAGRGALSAEQTAALRDNAGSLVTHADVAPTLLDLLGVWGSQEMLPVTQAMPGHSLLRPLPSPPVIPMTNCSETFPCPFNNWGMLQGNHKIQAEVWDSDWSCQRTDEGGEVDVPLDDPACDALVDASRAHFPLLPSGALNVD